MDCSTHFLEVSVVPYPEIYNSFLQAYHCKEYLRSAVGTEGWSSLSLWGSVLEGWPQATDLPCKWKCCMGEKSSLLISYSESCSHLAPLFQTPWKGAFAFLCTAFSLCKEVDAAKEQNFFVALFPLIFVERKIAFLFQDQ